jgi:hypothetical protein
MSGKEMRLYMEGCREKQVILEVGSWFVICSLERICIFNLFAGEWGRRRGKQ